MRHALLLLAVTLSTGAPAASAAETRIPETAFATASELREQALADDTAWQLVESLTPEIGPRLAGSEADARAVQWARAKFEELGFDRVWLEPVTFPEWERHSESAAITGTHAQPLTITALGGSPGGTVEADVPLFVGAPHGRDALRRSAPWARCPA